MIADDKRVLLGILWGFGTGIGTEFWDLEAIGLSPLVYPLINLKAHPAHYSTPSLFS